MLTFILLLYERVWSDLRLIPRAFGQRDPMCPWHLAFRRARRKSTDEGRFEGLLGVCGLPRAHGMASRCVCFRQRDATELRRGRTLRWLVLEHLQDGETNAEWETAERREGEKESVVSSRKLDKSMQGLDADTRASGWLIAVCRFTTNWGEEKNSNISPSS